MFNITVFTTSSKRIYVNVYSMFMDNDYLYLFYFDVNDVRREAKFSVDRVTNVMISSIVHNYS